MATHSIEIPQLGLQIPMLEGATAGVPTKAEIAQAVGVVVTDEVYSRLLNEIMLNDGRTWLEIMRDFIAEDRSPDHSWS